MMNGQAIVNETGIEFLVFSNVFEAANSTKAQVVEVLPLVAGADAIYRLIKSGTFAFGSQQVIDAFRAAAGTNAAGQPVDIKAVIKLCLQVSAASQKSGNALNIWFDSFSGRLELSTANGMTDSLTVFAAQRNIAA